MSRPNPLPILLANSEHRIQLFSDLFYLGHLLNHLVNLLMGLLNLLGDLVNVHDHHQPLRIQDGW